MAGNGGRVPAAAGHEVHGHERLGLIAAADGALADHAADRGQHGQVGVDGHTLAVPVVRILVIRDPHKVLAGLETAHKRGVDLAEADVVLLGETGDGQRGIRTGHHTHQELTAAAHFTAMILIRGGGIQLPRGQLHVFQIVLDALGILHHIFHCMVLSYFKIDVAD